MRYGAGWPMGPCALLDLVGADVHVHASEALYEKLREPRMAPPARLVRMLKAGKLGGKPGEGFSRYDGRRPPPVLAWPHGDVPCVPPDAARGRALPRVAVGA